MILFRAWFVVVQQPANSNRKEYQRRKGGVGSFFFAQSKKICYI